MDNNYLQPYFDRQQQVMGIDPVTGLAQVGFSPAHVARFGINRVIENARARRYARQHGQLGGYGDDWDLAESDALGAADYDELDACDEEIAAIDEEDDYDELGARSPEGKLRKLRRKEKRAQKAVARIERRLDRVLPIRRRKRARLQSKLDKAQDKVQSIRSQIRSLEAGTSALPAVRPATPAETRAVTQGVVPDYGSAMNSQPTFMAAPNSGQQVELPITFDATGDKLFEATVAATTAAGTQVAITGETTPKTYLELQVVGLKVVAFLNAPLMTDGGATPLGVAITEQSAQCAIAVNNLTVDGGVNMYPDDQILNVGGNFGASSEKLFDGLRTQDVIFENGKVEIAGFLELAFQAAQAYNVSLKMAVICNVLRDKRLSRGR